MQRPPAQRQALCMKGLFQHTTCASFWIDLIVHYTPISGIRIIFNALLSTQSLVKESQTHAVDGLA